MPSRSFESAQPRWMNRCVQLVSLLVPLAFIGCGESPEKAASDKPALVSERAATLTPESSEGGDEVENARFVSVESLPEHWVAPLDGEDMFFTPPKATEVQSSATEAPKGRANVKFLGLVTLAGEESATKAILKIEGNLTYLAPGEKFGGIELLSIDERTVSLQQGRERWSLALVKQASTNAAVPYKSNSASDKREPNPFNSRSNRDRSVPDPEDELSGKDFANDGLPTDDIPGLDLPEIELPNIELPEVEIPDIDLPEIDLPGIDFP